MKGYELAFLVATGLSLLTVLTSLVAVKRTNIRRLVVLLAVLTFLALLVTLGWNALDGVSVEVTRTN